MVILSGIGINVDLVITLKDLTVVSCCCGFIGWFLACFSLLHVLKVKQIFMKQNN